MTFDAARRQAQENAVRYGYPWDVVPIADGEFRIFPASP
jgi:hypothetical protein